MLKDKSILRSHNLNQSWQELNDKELWMAFLDGSKEAFEFIYQKHIDELFSYGMKVRPHRNLVKDSIHDLFIELWNRKSFLSFTDSIRFYLYRSLRRKICQLIERDKKLYSDTPIEDLSDKFISQPMEYSYFSVQTDDDKKRKVTLMLSKLTDRQQEVIRLLFFEKMSYEKVSEIMAINVRSVYTLAWKAISAIRKSLPILILFAFQ